MDRSERNSGGEEYLKFENPKGEGQGIWASGETEEGTDKGPRNEQTIISRIKAEISEDVIGDIELPKTPTEISEDKFEPEIPSVTQTEPSKIVKWVSEISQWDALYGLSYTMASTTGATIFGLVIGKAFEFAAHWSLILLFVIGLISAISTKILKQRDQKQKLFMDEKQQELKFKEEIHNQTLKFNKETFKNKLTIELKREELRSELERNDAIDIWQMYYTLVEERPTSGIKLEYQLYMKTLEFAKEVVRTHALDRALRYNKYEIFEYNKVIDKISDLSDNIKTLLNEFEFKDNGGNNYKDKFNNITSTVNKYKALVQCEEYLKRAQENEFGVITLDNDFIIKDVNIHQVSYTGVGAYNSLGKDMVKIIEENYTTKQINPSLEGMTKAYRGTPNRIIFKNFHTLDGNVVDIQLCAIPDFNEITLEIEGIYIISCDIEHTFECEKIEVEIPIEKDKKLKNEIILLIGTTIEEDIIKYQKMFGKFGYQMVVVKSITEAIGIMETQLVHLALIGTIFKDGMADEMVKEMIKRFPNIQIVVVATHQNPALEAKLKEIANISDYLIKPVAPQIILNAIQKAEYKALTSRISTIQKQIKQHTVKNGDTIKKKPSKVDMSRPR